MIIGETIIVTKSSDFLVEVLDTVQRLGRNKYSPAVDDSNGTANDTDTE